MPDALELSILELVPMMELATLLGISHSVREVVHNYLRIAPHLKLAIAEEDAPRVVPLFRRGQLLRAVFAFSRRCQTFHLDERWLERSFTAAFWLNAETKAASCNLSEPIQRCCENSASMLS